MAFVILDLFGVGSFPSLKLFQNTPDELLYTAARRAYTPEKRK